MAFRFDTLDLTDGGVADNIGLRGPLEAIASTDPSWSVLRMMNLKRVDKLAVIVVNAVVPLLSLPAAACSLSP